MEFLGWTVRVWGVFVTDHLRGGYLWAVHVGSNAFEGLRQGHGTARGYGVNDDRIMRGVQRQVLVQTRCRLHDLGFGTFEVRALLWV